MFWFFIIFYNIRCLCLTWQMSMRQEDGLQTNMHMSNMMGYKHASQQSNEVTSWQCMANADAVFWTKQWKQPDIGALAQSSADSILFSLASDTLMTTDDLTISYSGLWWEMGKYGQTTILLPPQVLVFLWPKLQPDEASSKFSLLTTYKIFMTIQFRKCPNQRQVVTQKRPLLSFTVWDFHLVR